MPNPKDWFRRRPSIPDVTTASEKGDPFAEAAVLDLGRNATQLTGTAPTGGLRVRGGAPPQGTVPPPRSSEIRRREGTVIERSAFTTRPSLVRSEAPAHSVEPLSPKPVPPPESRLANFAAKRAVPLTIPPRPRIADSPPPAAPQSPPPEEGTEKPAFTLAAPGVSWTRAHPPNRDDGRLNALLREAFTPTRPKHNATLFSGRYRQMQRIIAAIEEERAHVVIYGERGSGKTSLANVLAAKAEEAGYFVLRFACSSELSFDDIFRSFLRRIPATLLADGIGATSRSGIENFEQLLPGNHCGVAELVAVFERIHDKHVVLIIDEYDRVVAEDTKNRLAELIKNMSDAAAPVTLLLIGVAENVKELMGKHPSLQRSLVTIPMPLMTRREIDGIIAGGEEKSGLKFDPGVRQIIVDFAQGLPYHAQLLGLFAARNTVRRRAHEVDRQDLRYALQRAEEETDSRIKEAYNLAVGNPESPSFRDVLFYAARCRTDEFGSFTVADVAAAAERRDAEEPSLLALQYPLKKLTEPERGAMLRRTAGPGGLRYQFITQMMRHYVLLRQAEARGLV